MRVITGDSRAGVPVWSGIPATLIMSIAGDRGPPRPRLVTVSDRVTVPPPPTVPARRQVSAAKQRRSSEISLGLNIRPGPSERGVPGPPAGGPP